MVNFRIIWKIIGSLLFIEAFFMTWCLGIALWADEDDILAFLLSMILTAGAGKKVGEQPRTTRGLRSSDGGMGHLLVLRHVPLLDTWLHHQPDRCLLRNHVRVHDDRRQYY